MERLWREPTRSLRFGLGSNLDGLRSELLVGREQMDGGGVLELRCVESFERAPGHVLLEPGVLLEIGRASIAGQATAVWRDSAGLLRRIDELALPGGGMHVVPLGDISRALPEAERSLWVDPESVASHRRENAFEIC